jgi:hypothetical protein
MKLDGQSEVKRKGRGAKRADRQSKSKGRSRARLERVARARSRRGSGSKTDGPNSVSKKKATTASKIERLGERSVGVVEGGVEEYDRFRALP